MAEKCNVNLSEISERVETIVVTNTFMEGTTDELITDITKELENIMEEFAISNITEVVDTIYSALAEQGAVERNPSFFSVTNIRNILEGASLGIVQSNTSEASAEHASFQEAEQMQLRQNVTSEFLDTAYGMVTDAREQAIHIANQHIFDALFINRGSIKIEGQNQGIVKTNLELNRNAKLYQQQLLNKVVEYLNSIITKEMTIPDAQKKALANPILYDNEGNPTGVLTTLRPLINNYLSRSVFKLPSDPTGMALDGLRSLYNMANNPSDPNYKSAKLQLDAYNANVILQNFDSYLHITLGDIIEIQDFGKKTGRDNKYAIGKKTAKLLTTWTTTEDRDIESEADFITKLAINTTPLYNWQGNRPIPGKFLTFADYQYIIGKIKDLSWNAAVINCTLGTFNRYGKFIAPKYWDTLSEKTKNTILTLSRRSDGSVKEVRFSSLINMIRRNPRKYLGSIFELLSNDTFLNTLGISSKTFSEGDKKVIYSLSKGIFSSQESNSLYRLSSLDAETDYYSFITQVADTIFNVGYVQYYRDSDGILQARTFISQNINNLRRTIEATINAANSTKAIKDFNAYEKSLDIREDSKQQITFTIPGTSILATVHSSGSRVIFTDQNGQSIDNFEVYLKNPSVIQFIDNKLRLGISDNIDLQNSLIEAFEGKSKLMSDLLSFASRIVLSQHVIHNEIDPITDIDKKEARLKEIFGQNTPRYNRQLDMVESVQGVDINTLRTIAIAKANVLGVTSATQTKDGAGNGQSMQTQSRLLGSQLSQFELQEMQPWSATRDCLILNVPGLYEGVYTAKEYYDDVEGSKSFVDMCVSEFTYSSFINDYIGGLAIKLEENRNSLVGDGHIMLLPSVNSDKGTIGRIKIDLNKEIQAPDGTYKAVRKFNHEELRWLIAKQFGTIYSRMYEAVQTDWNELTKFCNENQWDIPSIDYLSNFKEFNEWWVKNSHIETINGKEVRIGNTFGEKSPAAFIKEATLRYNQYHRLNPLTFIDQTHFQSKEQSITVNNEIIKVKGSLAANQVLISQIARYNPSYLQDRGIDPTLYPDEKTFWGFKHKEILKSLIKSRFVVNTTGNKQNQKELEYLRKHYGSWINESGNVILAKVKKGSRTFNITSSRDLIRFQKSDGQSANDIIDNLISSEEITLHPAIETWNYIDYLFTQEFMDCTVGSLVNHPEKSKGKSREDIIKEAEFKKANGFTEGIDPRPALYKRVLEQEAAHFQAQHKRNVSFTASMHEFQLNLLKGIPEFYNLAVIDDIHDEQGTIMGLLNDIKPFDGATFVNPFVVLLENFALGGARAGISKKQFVHFKNERTGGGGIIKTAGFGLTNDWIRNSPFLQRMMQKMTDHVWLNEDSSPAIVNITRDYKGNPITLANRYFEHNGHVYEILRIESLGNNQYRRVLQEVEVDEQKRPLVNSHIGGEVIIDDNNNIWTNESCSDQWLRENIAPVNTNYKLWKLFGGDRSLSVNNSGKYLEYSNSSVENVVAIMNKAVAEGEIIVDSNGNKVTRRGVPIDDIETQDDIWQPLKQVDVHYLATAGAVKQGAANINSADKYHNDVAYDTQRIRMYQAGIQLDKEHHADDAELSLMTQVISACAAKGYTFEAAIKLYDALRKSTEVGIKEHLDAVKQFITSGDSTGVQEAMYEAIIHSLGTSKTNGSNFAFLVASDLIKQAREGKKIKFSDATLPLSDKTVYSKIFSTVSSYLTNAGIKQKIPGILSVLTPSYNIFKIYAGKKLEAYSNPREDLAIEQAKLDASPIFDVDNPATNISNIELGRTYKVTREVIVEIPDADGNLVQTTVPETYFEHINTPVDYNNLKRDITLGEVTVQDIRDLSSALHAPELAFQEGTPEYEQTLAINNQILNQYNWEELTDEEHQFIFDAYDIDESSPNLQAALNILKRIKKPISGQVTRVVEAVIDEQGNPLGRDLAAYNVRFTTVDGQSFQLWDLDSAQALYQINAAKELSEPDRTNKLLQIAQDIFPQHTIDINKLETLVRRMLQKDLMNLSETTPDVLLQYEELLKSQATFQPTSNQNQVSYKWAVNAPNSYEVSSAGDNRFSALFARFTQGTQFMGQDISNMTIEDVYQKVIKKSGKGLPPAQDSILYNPSLTSKTAREDFSYKTAYLPLWQLWASQNRTLIEELRQAVKGKVLTDKFAPNTTVTQARALADILTQSQPVNITNTESWYDRYAQWVNIYLGTGNGSELVLPAFSGKVTAENFNIVEPLVRQALINTTKVSIGGILQTVNKSSIKVQAYEIIMPKTFATNFGLSTFDSLQEIESNRDWFVEQYRKNSEVKINDNNFSVALKTSTGNHTYLLSRAQLDSIESNFHKVDRDNIGLMSVDGKTVRLDSKGNILYEVTDDFELWVDDQGTEVIVTNDLTFYINNTSFESIQISSALLDRPLIFRSVLDNIKKSKNKISKRFYNYITFGKESNLQNIFDNSIEYNKIPDPSEGILYEESKLIRALREKHTSFLKALDVVAARIPSQSMQSFMPMRVIAFDNPDINTAYVSTMQILLQGSDY